MTLIDTEPHYKESPWQASASDVAIAGEQFGFEINGRQVQLREPIKTLGTQTVSISLHPDVVVDVTIIVVRSMDDFLNQQRRAAEADEQLDDAYELAEESAAYQADEVEEEEEV